MGKNEVSAIRELGRNVKRFAGEAVWEKVMEGSEGITAHSSKDRIAIWVKGAMERLDEFADEDTRTRVMVNCGYNCAVVHKFATRAKASRMKFKSLDEYLKAEERKPARGTRLFREGKVVYQFYTPQVFSRPMRCYCSLLRALPVDETVSPTYCQCARGFVEKTWEAIIGKPVKVDLLQSAVSGAKECKFAIHL